MNLDPPIPVFVIAILSGLAIALAIRREILRRRPLTPGWFHPVCLILRVAAIAALTLILLNPSQQNSSEEDASVQTVILLDASASMTLASESEGLSRWDEAVTFANAATTEIGETELSTFAEGLTPNADLSKKPDGRATNLATALQRVLTTTAENAPAQIVVLSDGGIHDRADLGVALGLANAAKVPISTKVFGVDRPPRNLSLTAVQAPRMVRPRSPVSVHVDIAGSGIADNEVLRLELFDEKNDVIAESDFYLDGEGEAGQVLVFESGLRTGKYQLKLHSESEGADEVDLSDNEFSFRVEIATGKLRVLFVEGTHVKRSIGSRGHWWNDMEHMTRAWDATGEIEYDCLTPMSEYVDRPNLVGVTFQNGEMRTDPRKHFPQTRDEVYSYDVMLFSDVPVGNFSKDQMGWVVDWVQERGGGYLMGGGYASFDVGNYDKTPWEQLVPVDMTSYGDGFFQQRFDITIPDSVKGHPLWTISHEPKKNQAALDLHPQFTGMNRVRRAKPGALVLATRKGSDEPVIAAQQYGRGRSIAFLPDPNGGWARFYLGWGPPGGSVIGAHTELGHGHQFKFKEAAAKIPDSPQPTHPAPYYAQFWVNTVRWLGENSVRWQRDKLAGRVISAQAHLGEKLPIAAEVIPVTELDELLSLDVGARLEGASGRRIRLNYDRDRREFTGELSVPNSLGDKTELNVIFDTTVRGQNFSESVAVGIHRGNPEFSQPKPDPVFLADLASATGGSVLQTVGDATESSRKAAERRRSESKRSWSEPLWASIWPLAIFGICLSLEWALRRRGEKTTAKIKGEVYG